MSQPLLLILDSLSLQSGGLDAALAQGGWDVVQMPSAQAAEFVGRTETALVLMDPIQSGEAGLYAIQEMRAMDQDVPVVLLKSYDENGTVQGFHAPVPGVIGNLDRAVPFAQWPSVLNGILASVRAEKHKFTAEELFADILADIEAPRAASLPLTQTQSFLEKSQLS